MDEQNLTADQTLTHDRSSGPVSGPPTTFPGGAPAAPLALLLALEVGTAALWVLWHVVGGVDLAVHRGDGLTTIGLAAVLITTALAAVAAFALRWLLRHRERGGRTWTILACLVWVVSLLGPLGAATVGAGVALVTLHLWVGGALVVGVRRLDAVGRG